MIAGVVLAAGGASRFGSPKQLATLDGEPLLAHAVEAMLAVPAIEDVIVVLGAQADRVAAEVDLSGSRVVVCEQWSEGMAASLRCGVRALGDCEWVIVTLGDVGARELLAGAAVRTFEAGHLCDPADVDTPEDLEALRT